MKIKTTRKQMEQYNRIVRIGYCDAQEMLKYRSPFAYSCGVYGWNGDYYEVDGVLIATGYRSLPSSKNVKCEYEDIRRFEGEAEKAQTKDAIESVLNKFIEYITR